MPRSGPVPTRSVLPSRRSGRDTASSLRPPKPMPGHPPALMRRRPKPPPTPTPTGPKAARSPPRLPSFELYRVDMVTRRELELEIAEGERRDRPIRRMLRGIRRRIDGRPALRRAYRVIVGVLGGAIAIVGLLLVPLPGPGWLIVF